MVTESMFVRDIISTYNILYYAKQLHKKKNCGYLMIPNELLDCCPELQIRVSDEAMIDAGFEPGCTLTVRLGAMPHDCDYVLACISGKPVIRAFFTDHEGLQWLVPRNSDYDAIQIQEGMNWWIIGVVVRVTQPVVRASSQCMQKGIEETKKNQSSVNALSDETVDRLIMKIGCEVKLSRQWYAVFRSMVDCQVQNSGDIKGFCSRVCRLLPDHQHLPEAKEVSRMAVLSFAKPVSQWTRDNAPVRGSRFAAYLRIARIMGGYLDAEMRKNRGVLQENGDISPTVVG